MFPKTGPIGTRSLCSGALAAGALPGPGASEQQIRQKFPALGCAPCAKREKAAMVLAGRFVSLKLGTLECWVDSAQVPDKVMYLGCGAEH